MELNDTKGEDLLKVAIVTGDHPYEVVAFHRLIRSLAGMDVYIQNIDNFAHDFEHGKLDFYDVFVFFNYHQDGPTDEDLKWFKGKPKSALEFALDSKKGVVMWHHGMLAFPQWDRRKEMTGLNVQKMTVSFNETIPVEVLNSRHPITEGLSDWAMVDETYNMDGPSPDCDVLLRTTHPECVKELAWTRVVRGKRSFVFQSGHDGQTWSNENFQRVLHRGIQWASGRI
ncbi:ThuA domain-containing protein [Puniceicoccaceae bacterium K14]|nr:ThuA domain-containing protein [Puniceicoccaceae bacterium K14]